MKAFIEVAAGTDQRPVYDEQTFEYQKTITVYRPYPYAYGFLLNTKSGDGAHLDCYVMTKQSLKSGSIVEVEPIGMVESFEDNEEDHKILVVLQGEHLLIDAKIEKEIREFGAHYFDHRPDKKIVIGKFLGYNEATALIKKCSDNTILLGSVRSGKAG